MAYGSIWDEILDTRHVQVLRTYIERWPRKGREPEKVLIVNEQHLGQVLTEYLMHYNTTRPHRSLGQLTPAQAETCPPEPVNLAEHRIHANRSSAEHSR